jgi:hypothetical protein
MPMIDVYAPAGTFADPHALAVKLADTLNGMEQVPDIPMFRKNTAAFVHELPPSSISNVDGESNYVRVQVLTNADALDRGKQLSVVQQFTSLVAEASGDEGLKGAHLGADHRGRPWWMGLSSHAHTNEELVAAARAEISRLSVN